MTIIQRKDVNLSLKMETSVGPDSLRLDENGNTLLDIIFSTGTQVVRRPWYDEDYIEELSMDASHIRLERLNAGAPVLNNHDSYELENMLGAVVRDSAKIEDEKGVCSVRLSKRESVSGLVQDIKDGIISKISVGYKIHAFREIAATEEGKLKKMIAEDWEPLEVSFVCIPADNACESRSEETPEKENQIILTEQERSMTDVTQPISTPVAPKVDVTSIEQRGVVQERKRVSEINEASRAFKMDEFAADHIEKGTESDEFRKLIIAEKAKIDGEQSISSANLSVDEKPNKEERNEAIANAILARVGRGELSDAGKSYRGMKLSKIAAEILETEGVATRNMSDIDIAERSMMGTSDFPLILEAVANKALRHEYREKKHDFLDLVSYRTVSDFKDINVYQTGGVEISKIHEKGEIENTTFTESKDSYRIESYAGMLTFSRAMIVNDDMYVFEKGVAKLADAIIRMERKVFWETFKAMTFSSGAKNLQIGGPSALTLESLDPAVLAMKKQKSFDGKVNLHLKPKFLIVPTTLGFTADKLMTQVSANENGKVNIHAGKYKVIESMELDDDSVKAWYLSASQDQIDLIEWARLAGHEAPRFSTNHMFDKQGMQLKVEHDFAMKVVDNKGFNKSKGEA